jgi:hypothetical protein
MPRADTDLDPLPDDFVPTPRSTGEPEPPPTSDPFGHRGALVHRKQTLTPGKKRTDQGMV